MSVRRYSKVEDGRLWNRSARSRSHELFSVSAPHSAGCTCATFISADNSPGLTLLQPEAFDYGGYTGSNVRFI
jgi:hypothetical protein